MVIAHSPLGWVKAQRCAATLPVGETGVARARAARVEGDHPPKGARARLHAHRIHVVVQIVRWREDRGDRSGRRRLRRFTLARARAEPLHVLLQVKRCERTLAVPKARRQREIFFLIGRGRSADGDGRSIFHSRVGYRIRRHVTELQATAQRRPSLASRLPSLATSVGVLGMAPMKRTSPSRPSSAVVTEMLTL
jgi:hypothetical protein